MTLLKHSPFFRLTSDLCEGKSLAGNLGEDGREAVGVVHAETVPSLGFFRAQLHPLYC
jgi:hypothetical protein